MTLHASRDSGRSAERHVERLVVAEPAGRSSRDAATIVWGSVSISSIRTQAAARPPRTARTNGGQVVRACTHCYAADAHNQGRPQPRCTGGGFQAGQVFGGQSSLRLKCRPIGRTTVAGTIGSLQPTDPHLDRRTPARRHGPSAVPVCDGLFSSGAAGALATMFPARPPELASHKASAGTDNSLIGIVRSAAQGTPSSGILTAGSVAVAVRNAAVDAVSRAVWPAGALAVAGRCTGPPYGSLVPGDSRRSPDNWRNGSSGLLASAATAARSSGGAEVSRGLIC